MKSELLNFRASSQEVQLLEALVKSYGTNKSELLRFMIRREAQDRALEVLFKSQSNDQARLVELSELIS